MKTCIAPGRPPLTSHMQRLGKTHKTVLVILTPVLTSNGNFLRIHASIKTTTTAQKPRKIRLPKNSLYLAVAVTKFSVSDCN